MGSERAAKHRNSTRFRPIRRANQVSRQSYESSCARHKSVTTLGDEPCNPFNSMLPRARVQVQLRRYVRRATECRSALILRGHPSVFATEPFSVPSFYYRRNYINNEHNCRAMEKHLVKIPRLPNYPTKYVMICRFFLVCGEFEIPVTDVKKTTSILEVTSVIFIARSYST